MRPLPIDPILPELLQAVGQAGSAVLVAEPGAGKTTRVPPAILGLGRLSQDHPAVVLLQPRRVAARAAASRIAEEHGWTVGREVGYHVRFDRRVGPETRLRVATEGVLNRQILADPFLEGVGAVVLDEFHERSLHTDLALALLREVKESVRPDLILIVMSATLDAGPVADFLGGAPVIQAEGRSFPVAVEYLPGSDARAPVGDRVAHAVAHAIASDRRDDGDILVFLPGMEEIRRSARALGPLAERERLLVLPLHGSLSPEDQDRALRPADRRKVVLATNVAETSLTIEGVTTVIDTGLARYPSHDPARGLDRLELGRISRASAAQRAGRAGRTRPGRCLRLWPEREDRARPAFDEPEIRRADLAATVLALHAWGQPDPARFGWFEPPAAAAIEGAGRLLHDLGALEGGRITPIGRRLLELPLHPRLGRLMVEAAALGRVEEGAALAALLSEKDLRAIDPTHGPPRRPASHGRSDLLERLDTLRDAERARFAPGLRGQGIDPAAARRVAMARDDLLRVGRRLPRGGSASGDREDDLLRMTLAAYPDRVCRRRPGDPTGARMVGGRGVRLAPESVVREADLFLALDPRDDRRTRRGTGPVAVATREALARLASAVEPEWLDAVFPGSVRVERTVRFDEARGRAIAVRTTLYRDLPLSEETHGAVNSAEASEALAQALAPRAESFLRDDPAAARLLDRLAFLREAWPDLDLPALGPDDLAEILAAACAGRRTIEEVRRVSLAPLILGRLSFAQTRTLEDQAPESIQVPTGNRIRLTYEPGRPPVLAVRLQEMFGLAETPRLAGGRVAVLLHLLGPNHRPVQVTDDLRSFWTTTYHQVRKDLRNRYPKHAWPDDPWTAPPESKGTRR